MSLYGALRTGVSGLAVQSQALAVISDNIANVNTTGYKVSKPRFSTLVTDQSSATQYSSGGVQNNIGREIDAQGILQASSVSTDLAISGDGFFAVSDDVTLNTTSNEWEATGDIFYTRAGEFRVNNDGNLVNTAGMFLLGWTRNATDTGFDITNVAQDFRGVNVANQSALPIASDQINVQANLAATAATGDIFPTTVQIFDKQGIQRTLTLQFVKDAAPDVWDVRAAVSGNAAIINIDNSGDGLALPGEDTVDADGNPGADGFLQQTEIDALIAGGANDFALPAAAAFQPLGSVTFNSGGGGSLQSLTTAAGDLAILPTVANGQMQIAIAHDGEVAADINDVVAITLDFGSIGGADGLTSAGNSSVLNNIDQDGRQFGSLAGVSVNADGEVIALFDNEETRLLYQLPITTFNNPNGLEPISGNVFRQTDASGTAVARAANQGGAGTVSPNSIESSTVDLADEFTDMIITQRAYSASTRIITTSDEMLTELLQIKR